MSSLLIRYFGPINEGFIENDGFLDITPITVFIGNQATGKSTVAKVYSSCSWLEKALVRGDYKGKYPNLSVFVDVLKNQRIDEYLTDKTELEFRGKAYIFKYYEKKFFVEKNVRSFDEYSRPKIMYIPAERNLLTVLKDAGQRKNLPQMLAVLLDEYQKANESIIRSGHRLPVSMLTLRYNKETDVTSVVAPNATSVSISDASSGVQSVAPLSLVTEYLRKELDKDVWDQLKLLSQDDRNNIKKYISNQRQGSDVEIQSLLQEVDRYFTSGSKDQVSEENRPILDQALRHHLNSYLINIVEEPEQNLYPESQEGILCQLLEVTNANKANELFITTHSPYLLSFLTVAAMAHELIKKGVDTAKIEQIIPPQATVGGERIAVFETLEDGTIRRVPPYENLPSDENLLNKMLNKTNEDFYALMDLEDEHWRR